MVPGSGFEPPTRGFSVRCSTPELPGRSAGFALIPGDRPATVRTYAFSILQVVPMSEVILINLTGKSQRVIGISLDRVQPVRGCFDD